MLKHLILPLCQLFCELKSSQLLELVGFNLVSSYIPPIIVVMINIKAVTADLLSHLLEQIPFPALDDSLHIDQRDAVS